MSEPSEIATKDLTVTFRRTERLGQVARIPALRGLSLTVRSGEVLAVVGSSGAGKSVLAHALLGILPGNAEIAGDVLYQGQVLTKDQLARLRGRQIALVPQSIGFLDPLLRVGKAVCWAARRSGLSKTEATAAQEGAFDRMGLSREVAHQFPFQLSGGMARRVLLAMAAVSRARVVIADEPTPGLHPEAVQETMQQLREFADQGSAILLISHDVSACLSVANRIAVFLEGTLVEIAPTAAFTGVGAALEHPYSRALWNALPENAFASAPQQLQQDIQRHNRAGDERAGQRRNPVNVVLEENATGQ